MNKRRARGATMVEFLLVSPILLLLGLSVVQIGLFFHAKSALNFALQEAARSGAVNHADPGFVRDGLLRGLVPFMGGGSSADEFTSTLKTVGEEFANGTAAGWIRVDQLSPMPQSFADWQENSTDESGNPVKEIPNANLAILRCTRQPNGGSAGVRSSTACGGAGEPIGAASRQTLADANLLKLHMTYGVKLTVPFINRIVGRALAAYAGCSAPEAQNVGPLNLGTPTAGQADPTSCAAYNAIDTDGNPAPRIPVSLALTVRMQSTARVAGGSGWFTVLARGRDPNSSGPQLGNGNVDAASEFAPIPVSQLNPNGLSSTDDDFATFAGSPNSMHFGYDETLGDTSGVTCTGSP
jgi:hypothetical protein